MDVITIESSAYKHLIKRVENIEQMLHSVTKLINQTKEQKEGIQPEFISREHAAREFDLSLTTVDKKIKKFGVSRLPSGGKSLLNRQEFIKALQQPDPFKKDINSRKNVGQKVDPTLDPK